LTWSSITLMPVTIFNHINSKNPLFWQVQSYQFQ
jgi:hypothetical protein